MTLIGSFHTRIFFTAMDSSLSLSSLESPSMAIPPRALHRPPRNCNSQRFFTDGQRELGFPMLGPSHLGPFGLLSWTINESVGPSISSRPKSALNRSWIIACVLNQPKFPKHRGQALTFAVVSTQGLAGFYLLTRTRSVLNFLLANSIFVSRRQIFTIGRGLLLLCLLLSVQDWVSHQSIALEQFQLSVGRVLLSSVLSNSLLERGIYLWGSNPMKNPTFLTALLSSIPEEVTVLILMRPEVLKFPKSPYAAQAVTTLKPTADLVLRFNLERNLKPSNSIVDTLPNSYQFVYSSSFVKLVSLSIPNVSNVCSSALCLLSGLSDEAFLSCNKL